MKLNAIEIRGLVAAGGAPLALDLMGAPRGIVAITGVNGAGKSTLIGSVLGAVYGSIPNQPRFYDVATARDARLRASFELTDGRSLVTTRNVNGVAKQPTQDVTVSVDGVPVNDGAKATTADTWVEQHLPSLALTLATGFAAQRSLGDFAEATSAKRRAILSEIVDNEAFVALCEKAKLKVTEVERAVTKASAERDALRGVVARNEASCRDAAPLDAERARIDEAVSAAHAAVEAAERRLAEKEQAREAQADAERQRLADLSRAIDERAKARGDLDALCQRHANAMKAAQDALALATAAKDKAHAELDAASAKLRAARLAQDELLEVTQRIEKIRATDVLYEQLRRDEAAAVLAVERASEDMHERTKAQTRVTRIESSIESLTDACSRLDSAPCGAKGEYAKCPFIEHAVIARQTIPGVREEYTEALAELDAHPTSRAVFDRLRVDASDLTARATDLAKQRAALPDLERRRVILEAQATTIPAMEEEVAQLTQALGATRERLTEAQAALDNADLDSTTLKVEITLARDVLNLKSSAVGVLQIVKPVSSTAAEVIALRDAQRTRDLAVSDKAALDAQMQRRRDVDEQNAKLRADIDNLDATLTKLSDDLAEWKALAEVTGPNGAPAMALALAGPEISAIANGVLAESDGGRFTVSLETLRLSADGKKWLESFDIIVTDSRAGTAHAYETLSGGERVKVQLAIRLAIGIYAERRGRERWETLLLDEPSGALDPQAGAAYVDMLRWALKAGRLDRIIIITHDERIAAQADAHVHIDGTVTCDWTSTP